jgi:predicted  nucleic acid-binding Zn-ribbon protein
MIVICHKCGGVFEAPEVSLPAGCVLIEEYYFCDGCEGDVFLKVPISVEVSEN